METRNNILLAVCATFSILNLVESQNYQQGFISLDCGLPLNESPYNDSVTTLTYISDADFTRGGKTGKVEKYLEKHFITPYTVLRYFPIPDGIRNCYSLSVKQDTKYLIRTVFLYGNYDGLNTSPRFDLYLGPNIWTTVDVQISGIGALEEIIHITRSNSLEICLVKTGTSTPMISAIELRPLQYNTYIARTDSLKRLDRLYFTNSNEIIYPKDVRDRIWFPYFEPEWTQINTTLKVSDSSDGYDPPLDAFKTAAIPTNAIIAIRNIQSTRGLNRISWQGDPCVPKQFMWIGLSCSVIDMSTPPRIIALDLSSSGLTGIVPLSIQNLSQLQELDMSKNNLTGDVPEFLAKMKSLLVINLSGNNLSGSVPRALLDRKKEGLKLLLEGNKKLCVACGTKFPVVLVVASVSSAVIIIIGLVLIVLHEISWNSVNFPYAVIRPSLELKNRRFTYSEVKEMTNNFRVVLGKGGFGVVYGLLNNEQVAVKVLFHSSSQGYKEFKAEVELLLRVHHVNLVSLIGYCEEGNDLALIYELMVNGDLKEHLSGKRSGSVLSWSSRLKIASESALCL
ncbi:probable LRR receptor-like serine/threonine-protein kinase At1g07550 [Arabidopsis lyrata subsp. lyrata]|uniref:probable LRR receptor-like serine/threonine-protein kinase At1g07550 n=1 Tax=Arabidopsis lyrata subsp. lyrata TaxID=81972 RepID=UPI000A29EA0C|nr:probable LRR receptor-like serine/threonine-protein kinase At1g07550 [Arabidopsis lyrata subsp. lyrata]|eukprot:XP_020865698.1 probable LRR receptor-like serine/threonine-protein kinase At1g07550 [Arabidopsis lyrata subsp. lyrata]